MDALAENIKRIFNHRKADQIGKPYRPAPRFRKDAFWERAADTCRDLEADPHELVEAAFSKCMVPGGPFPSHMGGAALKKWYQAFCDHNKLDSNSDKSAIAQRTQMLIAQTVHRMFTQTYWANPRDYLASEIVTEHEVPAFVRVILLPNDAEILCTWGKRAHQQIIADPGLYKALEELGYDLTVFDEIPNQVSL